jgi:hypothetical protein
MMEDNQSRSLGLAKDLAAIAGDRTVDDSLQEAMTPEQLSHLLDQDELLKGASVTRDPLVPWNFTLKGAVNIYGEIHMWETTIDIRLIETADDFLQLVYQLKTSFEKAAALLAKG